VVQQRVLLAPAVLRRGLGRRALHAPLPRVAPRPLGAGQRRRAVRARDGALHAIHDFRALLDHLQAQGAPRIGVTGLSLGGYTSALAAAVEPRLDFAIPNAAVTSLPPLLNGWFPANLAGAAARTVGGVPRELLEQALLVHGPLHYPALLPRERLMIVAGLGDRLAPPSQSVLLWEHWRQPQLHWFPGSHVLHLGRERYLSAMRELIDGAAPAAPTTATEDDR
jgi:hypothetical protein